MNADLIIYNARIYTMQPRQPWADAVACRDGRIVAVGSNEEVSALRAKGTQALDAAGRLVLPGLTDSHVHFLQVAIRRRQVSLFGVANFEEVRRRVAAAAAEAEPGQWVLGWGWDENLWDISPDAQFLDDVAPNNPVVLARMCMHTWWVNSQALRQAHVTQETPNPPESVIERRSDGTPNGLLREWNAIELVEKFIPEMEDEVLVQWLREAMAEAHRLGLTGIHDQRVEREGARSLRLLQALNRRGELKLRVHANVAADFIAEAKTLGLQPHFGDERLWLGHVKAFVDGTMGSRTAWMLDPFEGDLDNYGIVVTGPDELWQLAQDATAAGFPLSVHAIGDRAVREVLDVLAELPPSAHSAALPMPHRIEHVQIMHPDDLPRLAQLDVVAAVQPVHLQTDWHTADEVWGARSRYAYAFRSLLSHGTRLAFGSDAPVAPLSPLLGVQAAVTRQDAQGRPAGGWYGEERVTLEEALEAYTIGPAVLAGRGRQGLIQPGKWADMVVLRENLFDVPPDNIANVPVDHTVFAGEIVFSR